MLNTFLNILLPAQCLQCQGHIEQAGTLCHICWRKITFISAPCCSKCSFPFDFSVDDESLCGACMAKEPLYDQADCVMIYDEHSAKLITRFKYGDKTQGAKTYANWMAQHVQTSMPVSDIDYITPVPIHRKRLLQRSYNQSALIAKFMANELALTFEPTLLKRDKNSPPQASLNRKDRVTNVKGCFAVTPKYATLVEGKSILLIDDVITTGSTVEECTKQLKRAGAKHVYVSTLAKTIK